MSGETMADGYEPETCPKCGDRLEIGEEESGYWLVCEECAKGWGPYRSKPDLWKKI